MTPQRIISGIQPTGIPHVGNYLGMLKQSVVLQTEHGLERIYFIADLHALTIKQVPEKFAHQTLETAMDMLALGLDPERSTLFVQSQIHEHTELMWILATLTPLGELERMTQFKDKAAQHRTNINAGLLSYPILMAADILLYKAIAVPVGEDQVQHVELTRILARKFNNEYGKVFPEPKPRLTPTARVMSLSDPAKKMSKSHGEKTYIALTDDPEVIKKKLAKAVTGTAKGKAIDPGVANLFAMLREVSDAKTVEHFEAAQKDGSISYAELKEQLAKDLADHLAPFREKRMELSGKAIYVKALLEEGRKKAATIAAQTMAEVREKVGLYK